MTRHLRVQFFGKTRKRILESKIQKQIMNPKYLHSRRILRIKSGFFRFTTYGFFGKRFEKSIFDKWFSMQKRYTTLNSMTFAQMLFSRHFHRTIEDTNRSKIVRFPANYSSRFFTAELILTLFRVIILLAPFLQLKK